jgi:hypothetical protein
MRGMGLGLGGRDQAAREPRAGGDGATGLSFRGFRNAALASGPSLTGLGSRQRAEVPTAAARAAP